MRFKHSAAIKSYRADENSVLQLLALSLVLCLAALGTGCAASSATGTSPSPATPDSQLKLSPPTAQGTVGVAYNAVSSVSGGTPPYFFSVASGSLPPGLVLNSTTGSIAGTPSAAGTYKFTLNVSSAVKGHEPLTPDVVSPFPENTYASSAASIVVSAKATTLTVSPSSATLVSQGSQQFSAKTSGSADTGVTWSATGGTISSTGVFTAPKVTSGTTVVVTAVNTHTNSQAAATVTVTPLTALAITTSAIAGAETAVTYSATLSAIGGVTPYQWALAGGSLPSGIQLQTASGIISGMATLAGSYPFTAKVTDSSGNSATIALSLTVTATSQSNFDGPAELPRIYIQTAMSNTPAPGSTISVNAGGDLQSALNSASCGDTIQLQAGATFTGVFTFPAKNCDANHWIIVRTSADDSLLPAEGSRLTPCYAGVASLPGRPAFQCTSTTVVTAKLMMSGTSNGPILFASGAGYYRLTGLEVTRPVGTGIIYALSSIVASGTASNIIFDRVWMHGTAQDETNKGIELGASSYVSVVDSFFTDFHCISVTGACTDALAIGGGASNPVGPYKITDNFLEASGENVIFGGAASTITPADIQISQNHFFKPLTWLKGQPGYVGGANGNPFIVKNLFELKNAQRVLFEGNILDDSWGGFSQNGFGIVITPKNQSANSGPGNVCPICQVTDVTIRYSTLSHLGAGLQIANALSDNDGAPLAGERYSIHDITIDDIDETLYIGSGHIAEIMTEVPSPLLQNVAINHVTAFSPSGGMFTVEGTNNPKMSTVTFTNSIFSAGVYPVWSTGGGTANCAYYDKPITTFTACFGPNAFANNAVIATPSGYPVSEWPTGNFFPASPSVVQFVNYNNADGGNYQLLSTSPYHNAGTDGKDLGADISTILSETAGVY
jgi:hypothetical protein